MRHPTSGNNYVNTLSEFTVYTCSWMVFRDSGITLETLAALEITNSSPIVQLSTNFSKNFYSVLSMVSLSLCMLGFVDIGAQNVNCLKSTASSQGSSNLRLICLCSTAISRVPLIQWIVKLSLQLQSWRPMVFPQSTLIFLFWYTLGPLDSFLSIGNHFCETTACFLAQCGCFYKVMVFKPFPALICALQWGEIRLC